MTREEAYEIIKEIRNKICSRKYATEQSEAFDMAIKALEQESTKNVLDKIRAELDIAMYIDKDTKLCKNANASGIEVSLQIIGKYRQE